MWLNDLPRDGCEALRHPQHTAIHLDEVVEFLVLAKGSLSVPKLGFQCFPVRFGCPELCNQQPLHIGTLYHLGGKFAMVVLVNLEPVCKVG